MLFHNFFFISKTYFGKEVKNDIEKTVTDAGVDNSVRAPVGPTSASSDIFYTEWMEREEYHLARQCAIYSAVLTRG